MKNAIILFTALFIFACESKPPNPLYLDSNGITIKAHKWANIGDKGVINGIKYEIVDRETLMSLIRSGNSYERVCTTYITSMRRLFYKTGTSQDISSWDVSNVEDMGEMFWRSEYFNQDISSWDVSNVMMMSYMFYEALSFNQDIGAWDVSNVKDMTGMFKEASSFNGDIGAWDVSNVMRMGSMFNNASSFNQDISAWDVSNVTKMGYMFLNASSFNQDLSSWDVANVTSCGDFTNNYGRNSIWVSPKPNLTDCKNSFY